MRITWPVDVYFKLPQPVEAFLSWYLHPRRRLSRYMFNLIFLLAFTPVLVIKFVAIQETAEKMAPTLQGLTSEIEHTARSLHKDGSSKERMESLAQNAMQGHSVNQQIFTEILNDMGYAPAQEKSVLKATHIVPLLIYIFLLPIIAMRLRDMGYRRTPEIIIYTTLIYTGVFLDVGKTVLGFNIDFSLIAMGGFLSFIGLLWISTAENEAWVSPCERMHEYTNKAGSGELQKTIAQPPKEEKPAMPDPIPLNSVKKNVNAHQEVKQFEESVKEAYAHWGKEEKENTCDNEEGENVPSRS